MKLLKKLKKFFAPYSEDIHELKEVVHDEMERRVIAKADKIINTMYADVLSHLDRRIDNLLKARAASKDKNVKQSYNGTIKELRTVRDMITGT